MVNNGNLLYNTFSIVFMYLLLILRATLLKFYRSHCCKNAIVPTGWQTALIAWLVQSLTW